MSGSDSSVPWFLVAVVALLVVSSAPFASDASETELPFALREELEVVVRRAAEEVFDERDATGQRHRRATYAKRFRPTDDGGWKIDFTVDTAEGETMRTDRFVLVLRRDGKTWGIVERQLQDTWKRLVRDLPGNERLLSFSGFEFEHEGFSVSAGRGTMIVDELLGEPESIQLAADEIEWSWLPPAALGEVAAGHWAYMRSVYNERLGFDAERAAIHCDAFSCAALLEIAFSGVEPIEESGLHPRLLKHHREQVERNEQRRKDDPFAGFRLPPRPEHLHWRVSVMGTDDDDWLRVAYDNESGRQVSVSAGGFGKIYEHPDSKTLASGFSTEVLERRPDRLLDYDLTAVRVSIDLALERSELITGNLRFSLRALRDLEEVGFGVIDLTHAAGTGSSDKDPALTIDRLETGAGGALTWVRLGTAAGLIRLPGTVREGETFEIRMEFQSEGSLLKHSPSYTYVARAGWLPFVTYSDAIEEFDLTLRVPSKFKALGVGNKLSEERRGGVTTTRWAAEKAHFPTVIFGEYIEDAPRSDAQKFDGKTIPVAIHVDRVGMEDWQIRPKQLRPLAEQAVNALNLYREVFGVDYPYDKLDLVNDPLGGLYGQSPGSIVYLGSAAFRGEGVLGSVGGTSITRFTKSLVAHEVGHQWWGSLVGNANVRNYWFVESLAEYAAALFVEMVNSDQGAAPQKGHRAYLDHVRAWRREILEREPLASVKDARVVWSAGGYRSALYSKGPYAFHMLRTIFGDEAMFAFLKALGQALAGRTIVTSDIQRVAEQSFGTEMDWFFDQWIRGVGLPEYHIDYSTRRAEDGTWIVSGRVRQSVLLGPRRMRLPGTYFRAMVPITVLGSDRQEYPYEWSSRVPRPSSVSRCRSSRSRSS